jgi:Flp pilus assembly protein TadB
VRGVKSGLPLNQCMRIIAAESPEPLRAEFQSLVDSQAMGVPLDQSLQRMYDRMPLPEVNFFSIVLIIQQKTGGNLSESLGNLSTVLRARKLMKEKVKALSSEAKASAMIIGSLPISSCAGLLHAPVLHHDLVHRADGPSRAARRSDDDVARHLRHEQDGQLQVLREKTWPILSTPSPIRC